MRLDIRKTYKLFIGGQFVRSESGRTMPTSSASGRHLDNACLASGKDFRDSVVAARKSFEGWSNKTAYLRGQILYRAAEMLQTRAAELVNELCRSIELSDKQGKREVEASIDRLVYYAGWSDKYSSLFGAVNPVASPHFNFTMPEPTGVVVVIAPDEPALLGLVSMLAPVILSGNSAVVLASDKYPLPAATFSEILATCDLPPGVVNLLTGKRQDLLAHIAGHMDVNAIVEAAGDAKLSAKLQSGMAMNLKRFTSRTLTSQEWFAERAEDPYWILDTVEFKTAWHPIGF